MLRVRDILGPEGRIAQRLEGYEARAEQIEMAEAVADAIANKRKLMVEAGTGVGKSFLDLNENGSSFLPTPSASKSN
jgi:ATP-dependent DNA helicase DinG